MPTDYTPSETTDTKGVPSGCHCTLYRALGKSQIPQNNKIIKLLHINFVQCFQVFSFQLGYEYH